MNGLRDTGGSNEHESRGEPSSANDAQDEIHMGSDFQWRINTAVSVDNQSTKIVIERRGGQFLVAFLSMNYKPPIVA